jgi:hypothetical protein
MKTLILTYSTTRTYRATLAVDSDMEMTRAIQQCLEGSGLLHGLTGIDPESIRFVIEGDSDAHG